MKMGCFLFSGFFWGSFLILLGVLIILKVLFDINIPIFRLFFAILLIYLGIQLLFGSFFGQRHKNTVLFEDARVETSGAAHDRYDVVFGKGVFDMTGVQLTDVAQRTLNVVFGSATVRIDPAMPVKVVVSAAFAGARMPDGSVVSFGEYTYRTKTFSESEKYLLIKCNVVFGGIDFVTQ